MYNCGIRFVDAMKSLPKGQLNCQFSIVNFYLPLLRSNTTDIL